MNIELPVVLLGYEMELPEGQFFRGFGALERIEDAGDVEGWHFAADGDTAVLTVYDGDDLVLIAVAAQSPLTGVRMAAAEVVGQGVHLVFSPAQVDHLSVVDVAAIAAEFDVTIGVNRTETPIVDSFLGSVAGGAR